MKMIKGFKYRIYPDEEQKVLLEKHFGCVRFVYNKGLEMKNKVFQETGKSLSTVTLMSQIKDLKNKEFLFLKEVGSQTIQQSLWNLESAFSRFFKKTGGFPTFKSKHKNKSSFNVPQGFEVNVEKSFIDIPKFKNKIKVVFHRKFKGEVGSLTLSKDKCNKYFVSISVDTKQDKIEKENVDPNQTIGIDLGLKHFIVDSNGNKVSNPKHLKKHEKRLSKTQRRFAKKQKDSKHKEKLRLKISKIHSKISNSRKDFHHKLSSKLVRDNQTICVEDLAVKNMMKNHKLAKSISDVGWSQFIGFLTYKADWYGKNILTIGRFEPSSKMCSCGKINQNLKLSDRIWSCPCGQTHDRDTLAANNIKKFGLITYDKKFGESQNIGREPSEFKPLENLASVGNRKVSFKSKSKKEEKQVEILSTKPTRSLAGR